MAASAVLVSACYANSNVQSAGSETPMTERSAVERPASGPPAEAAGATRTVSPGGAVSGSNADTAREPEKDERGNTPIGMDRSGHGPATGAIVDPAGVLSRPAR
jgi:hypothetical protein